MKNNLREMADRTELTIEDQNLIGEKINSFFRNPPSLSYMDKECLSCCQYFVDNSNSLHDPLVSFYNVEAMELDDLVQLGPKEN